MNKERTSCYQHERYHMRKILGEHAKQTSLSRFRPCQLLRTIQCIKLFYVYTCREIQCINQSLSLTHSNIHCVLISK